MAGTWSNEQTSELIELYQGEPTLYTVSNPNYHNKFNRQNALENIVKGLHEIRPNTTVIEIKAKINGLRARFSAELAKIRCKPSGSAGIAKVTFNFFEKLLFLQDHLAARKSFSNIPTADQPPIEKSWSCLMQEEEDDVEYSEQQSLNGEDENRELDEAAVHILSPAASSAASRSAGPASPAISEGRPKKRKRTANSNDVNDTFLQQAGSALNLLSKSSRPQIKDVWGEFGSFVASSLRNIENDADKIRCKHEILKTIMKYEEQNM